MRGLGEKENKKATIKRYRPIMAFFKEVIPLGRGEESSGLEIRGLGEWESGNKKNLRK
ncbi:hypothetical protein [Haliscomenobacter sp.]|uniref:hypothetical protein n=1 Tax=Haliscomenobacter sp. TaxID=2717303 RepID=UPI0035944ED7